MSLILYLASLSALAAFSLDIYLASMPYIKHLFHTTTAHVQLTLSLFLVAFAVMQFFWGPLSDRIGRRPVLVIGMALFMIGSLLSALSQSVNGLIFARVVQACGACSGGVMAMAIVKDAFKSHVESAKALSGVTSAQMIAPIVAPIIGSYLLVHVGWQANFYFLALGGMLLMLFTLRLKESHHKDVRKPLPLNRLFSLYLQELKNPPFLLATLAVATNFGVMFSFISSSSFVYIQVYQVKTAYFGYFFAFNAVGIILGGLTLRFVKGKVGDFSIIYSAVSLSVFGSMLMVVALFVCPSSVWSVAIPSVIACYGVGILYPGLTSYGLKHVVAYTGLASSLMGGIRFILAGFVGYIMGVAASHSAMPLALSMTCLSLLTAILVLIYFRHEKKFEFLSPHTPQE